MRLVSYEVPTAVGLRRRIGALRNDDTEIVDLNLAYQLCAADNGNPRPSEEANFFVPPDMLEFLRGEHQSMQAAKDALGAITGTPKAPNGGDVVVPRDQVKLLAPVPRPMTIREFSEWEEHMSSLRGGGPNLKTWYLRPSHAYNGNPAAVGGPDDDIPKPDFTDRWDLEPELGFYIGGRGANLSVEEAAEHIAGYTLFIDCSARDVGEHGGFFKHKDTYNVMGPCIVTPDEFDETSGKAWIKVNGETWWEYDIGHRRKFWSADVAAFASDSESLHPGDFFGLGTIGTGCSVDLGQWPREGDIFEFGVEGIGVLSHRVVAAPTGQGLVKKGLPGNLPVPDFPETAFASPLGVVAANADEFGERTTSCDWFLLKW